MGEYKKNVQRRCCSDSFLLPHNSDSQRHLSAESFNDIVPNSRVVNKKEEIVGNSGNGFNPIGAQKRRQKWFCLVLRDLAVFGN